MKTAQLFMVSAMLCLKALIKRPSRKSAAYLRCFVFCFDKTSERITQQKTIWQFELDCNSIWENICQLFALCNFASWAQCVVFKHWWKWSSRLESWIILDWNLHFICTVLSLFGQTFEQITEQQKPSWIFELGCNKFARELRHLSILH